jgi:hypothetical protein
LDRPGDRPGCSKAHRLSRVSIRGRRRSVRVPESRKTGFWRDCLTYEAECRLVAGSPHK